MAKAIDGTEKHNGGKERVKLKDIVAAFISGIVISIKSLLTYTRAIKAINRKVIQFLKYATRNEKWKKYYAKHDIERITKQAITGKTFVPPYTAGYTIPSLIEKESGIKVTEIRDNPNYNFENAIEQSNISIDYNIIRTPQPDRHKKLLDNLKNETN